MSVIQLKRGNSGAAFDGLALQSGELALLLDSKQIYVGTDGTAAGKKLLSDVVIGSAVPAAAEQGKIWLDTASNIIKKFDSGTGTWKQVAGFIENDLNAAGSPDKVYSTEAIKDLFAGFYSQAEIDAFLNTINQKNADQDSRLTSNENNISNLQTEVSNARTSSVVKDVDGITPKTFVDVDARLENAEQLTKDEENRAKSAEQALDAKISDEVTARTNADQAIKDELASQVAGKGASKVGVEDAGAKFAATNVEGVLAEIQGNVDAEKSRAQGEEARIEGKVDGVKSEVETARGTADNLDARLDGIEGEIAANQEATVSAQSTQDGKIIALEEEVHGARGTHLNVDARLDAMQGEIDAEEGTRASEVTRVEGLVSDEVTRAKAVEAGLETRLTTAESDIVSLETSKADLSGATFTGPVTVPHPAEGTHAATKAYVDNVASGISVETPVRALSESNIELAPATARTELVIDGVSVAVGERVLLVGQTTVSEVGPYVVQSDFSLVKADDVYVEGSVFFVNSGEKFGNAGFIYDGLNVFSQFTGGAQIVAGEGTYRSGNEIGVADAGITTEKVADAAVTEAKLDAALAGKILDHAVDHTGIAAGMFMQFDGVKWVMTKTLDGGTW